MVLLETFRHCQSLQYFLLWWLFLFQSIQRWSSSEHCHLSCYENVEIKPVILQGCSLFYVTFGTHIVKVCQVKVHGNFIHLEFLFNSHAIVEWSTTNIQNELSTFHVKKSDLLLKSKLINLHVWYVFTSCIDKTKAFLQILHVNNQVPGEFFTQMQQQQILSIHTMFVAFQPFCMQFH